MNRPTGYVIPPHVHNPVVREVEFTREALFTRSGRVRVDFYDDNREYLGSPYRRSVVAKASSALPKRVDLQRNRALRS